MKLESKMKKENELKFEQKKNEINQWNYVLFKINDLYSKKSHLYLGFSFSVVRLYDLKNFTCEGFIPVNGLRCQCLGHLQSL